MFSDINTCKDMCDRNGVYDKAVLALPLGGLPLPLFSVHTLINTFDQVGHTNTLCYMQMIVIYAGASALSQTLRLP